MIESKRAVSLFITIKDIIIFLKITVFRKINAHLKTFPFLLGKSQNDATDSQSGPKH